MPTGYTIDIAKGISFKQFALNCARAFGYCIEMRGEPFDKPIPDKFKPSTYHEKEIVKIKKELGKIEKIPLKKLNKLAKREYDQEITKIQQSLKEKNELHAKYSAMLDKVNAYQPPSPDHIEFKKFMTNQIRQSMEFDCKTIYWINQLDKIKLLSGEQWQVKEIARLVRKLEYHLKGNQAEIDRTNDSNLWIKQLRESLKD